MSDSRYKSIRRTVMGLLKYKTEKLYEMNLLLKSFKRLSQKKLRKFIKKEMVLIFKKTI